MFALNEHQKRELWKAFAQSSGVGYAFIKGNFHVKPSGKWLDTKHWTIDDAERAFGKSVHMLPVALTSLGAIGRYRDWSDARALLHGAVDAGDLLSKSTVNSLLTNSGFVMTGTGDINVLLNNPFFKGTPDVILTMLDKPGFYTLIHPKNHPRLRYNLSAEVASQVLEDVNGFRQVRHSETYIKAILNLMGKESRHYEIFRDQFHAFFAQNNISAQSSLQLPTPEDVEDWSPSVDPILKKAFSQYTESADSAVETLRDGLRLIYRPIVISSGRKERPSLTSLLISEQPKQLMVKNSYQERRENVRAAITMASLKTLLDTVQTSPSFSDNERAVVEDAWREIVEPHIKSDIDDASKLLVAKQFEETMYPWLIHKAENDYPKFVNYVKNTVFKGKDLPSWYSLQLQTMEPANQSSAVKDCSWWPAVSRLRKMCGDDIVQLLNSDFDENKLQSAVLKALPDSPHAFEWVMMSGFQSCFKFKTDVGVEQKKWGAIADVVPQPLPVKFI